MIVEFGLELFRTEGGRRDSNFIHDAVKVSGVVRVGAGGDVPIVLTNRPGLGQDADLKSIDEQPHVGSIVGERHVIPHARGENAVVDAEHCIGAGIVIDPRLQPRARGRRKRAVHEDVFLLLDSNGLRNQSGIVDVKRGEFDKRLNRNLVAGNVPVTQVQHVIGSIKLLSIRDQSTFVCRAKVDGVMIIGRAIQEVVVEVIDRFVVGWPGGADRLLVARRRVSVIDIEAIVGSGVEIDAYPRHQFTGPERPELPFVWELGHSIGGCEEDVLAGGQGAGA